LRIEIMKKHPIRVLAVAASLTFAPAAMAQDGPQGIAYAYAPEMSSASCVGTTMQTAMACAQRTCAARDSDLRTADCMPVAWCMPAGWSVVVGFMSVHGFHWSEFHCGWPTREAALAAGEVLCERSGYEDLQECIVGGLWDPEGVEIEVDG
jgi:hypothetical protein